MLFSFTPQTISPFSFALFLSLSLFRGEPKRGKSFSTNKTWSKVVSSHQLLRSSIFSDVATTPIMSHASPFSNPYLTRFFIVISSGESSHYNNREGDCFECGEVISAFCCSIFLFRIANIDRYCKC